MKAEWEWAVRMRKHVRRWAAAHPRGRSVASTVAMAPSLLVAQVVQDYFLQTGSSYSQATFNAGVACVMVALLVSLPVASLLGLFDDNDEQDRE